MSKDRGKKIVLLAQKLGCFVEQASRLYEKAEKENKLTRINEIIENDAKP
jgi:hypothetical protein